MSVDDEARAEAEFQRLYGPWDAFDIAATADLMTGFDAPWWIVGGHAIEAFTGVVRRHEDLDLVIFRRDLDRFRAQVGGRFHLWSAGAGALRPVTAQQPEPHADAGQVWLREHPLAPCVLDVILNADRDGQWVSRRNPEHVAPLESVTFVVAGVCYLRPELVLAHKARLDRPKDRADLRSAWPLLDATQQGWLRDEVHRQQPGHPWLAIVG